MGVTCSCQRYDTPRLTWNPRTQPESVLLPLYAQRPFRRGAADHCLQEIVLLAAEKKEKEMGMDDNTSIFGLEKRVPVQKAGEDGLCRHNTLSLAEASSPPPLHQKTNSPPPPSSITTTSSLLEQLQRIPRARWLLRHAALLTSAVPDCNTRQTRHRREEGLTSTTSSLAQTSSRSSGCCSRKSLQQMRSLSSSSTTTSRSVINVQYPASKMNLDAQQQPPVLSPQGEEPPASRGRYTPRLTAQALLMNRYVGGRVDTTTTNNNKSQGKPNVEQKDSQMMMSSIATLSSNDSSTTSSSSSDASSGKSVKDKEIASSEYASFTSSFFLNKSLSLYSSTGSLLCSQQGTAAKTTTTTACVKRSVLPPLCRNQQERNPLQHHHRGVASHDTDGATKRSSSVIPAGPTNFDAEQSKKWRHRNKASRETIGVLELSYMDRLGPSGPPSDGNITEEPSKIATFVKKKLESVSRAIGSNRGNGDDIEELKPIDAHRSGPSSPAALSQMFGGSRPQGGRQALVDEEGAVMSYMEPIDGNPDQFLDAIEQERALILDNFFNATNHYKSQEQRVWQEKQRKLAKERKRMIRDGGGGIVGYSDDEATTGGEGAGGDGGESKRVASPPSTKADTVRAWHDDMMALMLKTIQVAVASTTSVGTGSHPSRGPSFVVAGESVVCLHVEWRELTIATLPSSSPVPSTRDETQGFSFASNPCACTVQWTGAKNQPTGVETTSTRTMIKDFDLASLTPLWCLQESDAVLHGDDPTTNPLHNTSPAAQQAKAAVAAQRQRKQRQEKRRQERYNNILKLQRRAHSVLSDVHSASNLSLHSASTVASSVATLRGGDIAAGGAPHHSSKDRVDAVKQRLELEDALKRAIQGDLEEFNNSCESAMSSLCRPLEMVCLDGGHHQAHFIADRVRETLAASSIAEEDALVAMRQQLGGERVRHRKKGCKKRNNKRAPIQMVKLTPMEVNARDALLHHFKVVSVQFESQNDAKVRMTRCSGDVPHNTNTMVDRQQESTGEAPSSSPRHQQSPDGIYHRSPPRQRGYNHLRYSPSTTPLKPPHRDNTSSDLFDTCTEYSILGLDGLVDPPAAVSTINGPAQQQRNSHTSWSATMTAEDGSSVMPRNIDEEALQQLRSEPCSFSCVSSTAFDENAKNPAYDHHDDVADPCCATAGLTMISLPGAVEDPEEDVDAAFTTKPTLVPPCDNYFSGEESPYLSPRINARRLTLQPGEAPTTNGEETSDRRRSSDDAAVSLEAYRFPSSKRPSLVANDQADILTQTQLTELPLPKAASKQEMACEGKDARFVPCTTTVGGVSVTLPPPPQPAWMAALSRGSGAKAAFLLRQPPTTPNQNALRETASGDVSDTTRKTKPG